MANDNQYILKALPLSNSNMDKLMKDFDSYTRADSSEDLIVDISFLGEDDPRTLSNLCKITGYKINDFSGLDFILFYN